jgi:hypothetical protein
MNDQIPKLSEADAELLELGAVLGQNHAFGLVAGRCSAAQAQALRQLREEKKYKRCLDDWRRFCSEYLNISGAQADKIIALVEKYGPGYFELAQLTRISPQTYEVVAPAVQDGALHFNGEAIQLDPENARRVAKAVAQLRRQANQETPARSNPVADRLADIEKRFSALLEDIQDILRNSDANWNQFSSLLQQMAGALHRLKTENRLQP